MGTFGVLQPDDKPCTIAVKDCHINVWSLDGLLGRRVVLLDMGLRLSATTADQQSLVVIVPGETAPEPPTDLVPLLRDDATRTLIFAQTVPIANDVITVGGEDLELLPISSRESKSEVCDESFSQWHIHFARPLSVGRDSYVRIRFRLRRTERLWEWRRSGLVQVRAVIDFRIGDIRGVATLPDAETLACRALPIASLHLFIIAPLWLRMRAASPALKYMRLFEGAIWEKYLDRATKLGRREKLVIYQWQTDNITTAKPYRAFLDLGREPDVTALRNHLSAAVVFAAVTVLVIAAWLHGDPVTEWAARHARVLSRAFVGALSFSLLVKAASWFTKARSVLKKVGNAFESFEAWLFHVFRR